MTFPSTYSNLQISYLKSRGLPLKIQRFYLFPAAGRLWRNRQGTELRSRRFRRGVAATRRFGPAGLCRRLWLREGRTAGAPRAPAPRRPPRPGPRSRPRRSSPRRRGALRSAGPRGAREHFLSRAVLFRGGREGGSAVSMVRGGRRLRAHDGGGGSRPGEAAPPDPAQLLHLQPAAGAQGGRGTGRGASRCGRSSGPASVAAGGSGAALPALPGAGAGAGAERRGRSGGRWAGRGSAWDSVSPVRPRAAGVSVPRTSGAVAGAVVNCCRRAAAGCCWATARRVVRVITAGCDTFWAERPACVPVTDAGGAAEPCGPLLPRGAQRRRKPGAARGRPRGLWAGKPRAAGAGPAAGGAAPRDRAALASGLYVERPRARRAGAMASRAPGRGTAGKPRRAQPRAASRSPRGPESLRYPGVRGAAVTWGCGAPPAWGRLWRMESAAPGEKAEGQWKKCQQETFRWDRKQLFPAKWSGSRARLAAVCNLRVWRHPDRDWPGAWAIWAGSGPAPKPALLW